MQMAKNVVSVENNILLIPIESHATKDFGLQPRIGGSCNFSACCHDFFPLVCKMVKTGFEMFRLEFLSELCKLQHEFNNSGFNFFPNRKFEMEQIDMLIDEFH